MSVGVEALFTSALGLQQPWAVEQVKLDTMKRRIDFEIGCHGSALACPACGAAAQPVHDRLHRSWRHLDFFQFEAWLHCEVPRIACAGCGKTSQMPVPWARPGSGFTAAFEALALALCREMPVRQAAGLLRCVNGIPIFPRDGRSNFPTRLRIGLVRTNEPGLEFFLEAV